VLSGAQLDAAVRTLVSRPLKNLFNRAMLLKFARDPLGKQRPNRRNRFNIDNGARVLYLAENIPTALQEVQAFGFPPHAVAIVPVEVDLQAVVDLRDSVIQTALQLTSHDLAINFQSDLHGRSARGNPGTRRMRRRQRLRRWLSLRLAGHAGKRELGCIREQSRSA
jgi:hypothetical protein